MPSKAKELLLCIESLGHAAFIFVNKKLQGNLLAQKIAEDFVQFLHTCILVIKHMFKDILEI